jgi:hypothetical protein
VRVPPNRGKPLPVHVNVAVPQAGESFAQRSERATISMV